MALPERLFDTRLLYILCAVYITAIVLIPSVGGYEPSVYEGVPLHVWILFAVIMLVAITLLVSAALDKSYERTRPATILIFSGYAGFFALPISRGYYLYSSSGSDIWSHLGVVFDVFATGHLSDDRYPATNVLTAELSIVTGISPRVFRGVLAFFFFCLLLAFCALAVRRLSQNRTLVVCTILAATPLLFLGYAVSYLPWMFAMFILPLFLFAFHCYFTTRRLSWLVVTLVICFALTWYHPISMSFVLIALGVQAVVYWHHYDNGIHGAVLSRATVVASIGLLSLISWYIMSGRIADHIGATFVSLMVGEAGGAGRAETEAEYTLTQIISYFMIPEFGIALLYCLLAGLVFLFIFGRFVRLQGQIPSIETMTALQSLVGAAIALAFFAVRIHGTNPLRVAQYLILFSIFAVAMLLFYTVEQPLSTSRQKAVVSVVVIAVMAGIVFAGAATTYDDENHMTEAYVEGYGWHLDNKEPTTSTYSDTGRDRFAFYHFGYDRAVEVRGQGFEIRSHPDGVPDRLGYHDHQRVAEWADGSYLLVRTKDLTTHEVEPDWRLDQMEYIHPDNHERLHSGRSAAKLYDNNDVVIWKTAVNESETNTDGQR